MYGYSPVVPVEIEKQDGIKLTKSFTEVAKQNLKMVILTNPGERLMFPDFGVGLKHMLFELSTPGLKQDIRASIQNQVKMYLPYIQIIDIAINDSPEESGQNSLDPFYTYAIRISYSIDYLGIQDILEIEL